MRLVERGVHRQHTGHGGLAALASTVEEHARGLGAEQVLLPAVGLDAHGLGERHPVEGHRQVGCRPHY